MAPVHRSPARGYSKESAACVRGWGQPQTRCANCPAQPRGRAGLFPLIFRLFLFGFCCAKVFSFVAHAATGTPFSFRIENGGKEPRGGAIGAPFEPPFQRPKVNHLLFLAAGRLSGPSGRKPPADRETLEKPRSRAQLFKRFCAKGYACALRPISPFLSLLAGLVRPFGPQTAGR